VQEIGRELGVKYLLEGSVSKSSNTVRVDAQLVDTSTGAELWGDSFDRPLTDLFTVQDDIVKKIVTTLNLQVGLSEQGILVRRDTESLEAYDYFLHGLSYLMTKTKDGNTKAREMCEKAIQIDPNEVRRRNVGTSWTDGRSSIDAGMNVPGLVSRD
jgi:adenylate cyclase